MKNFLEHKLHVGDMFDPSLYKRPKAGIFFSRELEDVCQNHETRTRTQIRALRLTLRDCHSFGAYPDHVQTELSKLGSIERYGSGRIILREGHTPAKVYFVLSGTVVLTRFNKEAREEQTLQLLHKGDIFGDTEVLEQCKRTATVTSAIDVVLWSVDGQDFTNSMVQQIVSRKHRSASTASRTVSTCSETTRGSPNTAKSPVHMFLSSLDWFADVPTTKFLDDPKAATLIYFRNNKTIVVSSKHNDHLYFVRGGQCDVIAKISIATNTSNHRNVSCYDTGMVYFNEKRVSKIRPVTGIIRRDPHHRPPDISSRPKTAPLQRCHTAPASRISFSARSDQMRGYPRGQDQALRRPGGVKRAVGQRDNGASSLSHKEFLKVCRLEAGEVFGLTSLFDPEDLETSLVSRGCECVIVHKDTYRLLLNRHSRDRLKSKILQYPTYEEMKRKLRNFYAWRAYKADLKF